MRSVVWEYDRDGTWPGAVIEKAWEVGLMNAHIPEAYGGAGASFMDGALIEEELGWRCSGVIARETLLPRHVEPLASVAA
jgi:acyl-CoA dehydrogenase